MKIAIIGGGAAGTMAAAAAHETDPQAEIIILEKNDGLGKKVIISGGGRCNLTTGIKDIKTVLTKYPRGGKFLTKAMHRFSPESVWAWFESHGVPLKVEKDLRVFPVSNDGKDVVGVFGKIFRDPKINVRFKVQVMGIKKEPDGFEILVKEGKPFSVDKVILTTGGQAYRQTGSTGDGYAFAQSLGHSLTPLAPSLSALFTREKWVADLAGVSIERAGLACRPERSGAELKDLSKKGPSASSERHSVVGPFIFTHKGISGPAVFALSSLIAFEPISSDDPLPVSIDFFPDRKLPEVLESVWFHLDKYPKKSLTNVIGALLPKSLAFRVCLSAGLDPESPASACNKKGAERLAQIMKGFMLHTISRSPGEEFVTAGGVDLKEVDPSTMESKICPGLYLAGEILDIDGFTGGFNLQSAWATGRLAGESAVSIH
ncbi:aminoacetone oxidase family FAD-binding enzyme [Candidatus Uhrbacteria bacterium]|nr:aminoacetone oxidase family FAD-binding enzyme [Candidatus Uhrbacteria bacterium]